MDYCSKIIKKLYASAEGRDKGRSFIAKTAVRERVEKVALCLKNRAGVRALLACTLAKTANPKLDIRKPYTDIAGETKGDAYSGRLYDERYIQRLLEKPYYLPIKSTTAFLTPGFRTKNIALTPDTELEGRPADMYKALLMLFEDIQTRRVAAKTVLAETLRLLVIERDHRKESIQGLVRDIQRSQRTLFRLSPNTWPVRALRGFPYSLLPRRTVLPPTNRGSAYYLSTSITLPTNRRVPLETSKLP